MHTRTTQLYALLRGLFGIGAFAALSAKELNALFAPQTTETSDDTTLAHASSCPYDQHYLDTLSAQTGGEVFESGCGGLF